MGLWQDLRFQFSSYTYDVENTGATSSASHSKCVRSDSNLALLIQKNLSYTPICYSWTETWLYSNMKFGLGLLVERTSIDSELGLSHSESDSESEISTILLVGLLSTSLVITTTLIHTNH